MYEPLELTEDGGAILECIEGEVYDPPEIPMCYESKHESSLLVFDRVLFFA